MSEFMALMPTQLPDLLPRDTMEDSAIYPDYALLTFHPRKQYTIQQVCDLFEENSNLVHLYHRVVSEGLRGWQCYCAFSNPISKRMYKFNATADDNGIVHTITVQIFEDLEIMLATLRTELHLHHKAGGMRYEIDEADLIRMFF